jgi:transcriptional regulator with XRE-family HTH domain
VKVHKKMRALRKQIGLSRAELGCLYSVSERTVEAWEQGLRTPPDYIQRDLERVVSLSGASQQMARQLVVKFSQLRGATGANGNGATEHPLASEPETDAGAKAHPDKGEASGQEPADYGLESALLDSILSNIVEKRGPTPEIQAWANDVRKAEQEGRLAQGYWKEQVLDQLSDNPRLQEQTRRSLLQYWQIKAKHQGRDQDPATLRWLAEKRDDYWTRYRKGLRLAEEGILKEFKDQWPREGSEAELAFKQAVVPLIERYAQQILGEGSSPEDRGKNHARIAVRLALFEVEHERQARVFAKIEAERKARENSELEGEIHAEFDRQYAALKTPPVSDAQKRELVRKLQAWCDTEPGRSLQVADQLGCRHATLSKWFSGRCLPRDRYVPALRDLLSSLPADPDGKVTETKRWEAAEALRTWCSDNPARRADAVRKFSYASVRSWFNCEAVPNNRSVKGIWDLIGPDAKKEATGQKPEPTNASKSPQDAAKPEGLPVTPADASNAPGEAPGDAS